MRAGVEATRLRAGKPRYGGGVSFPKAGMQSPLDTGSAAGLRWHSYSITTDVNKYAGQAGDMKRCSAQWFTILAIGTGAAAAAAPVTPAQATPTAGAPNRAAEEKAACIKNLKVIYDAIQVFQVDHQDLPNWLSDLVPQYLADANVLVCPVCRRTGQTEAPPLADPKLPSSYVFEFCPVPLRDAATNAPTRTRRDWKRRQMGLVGSVVPLVRCRHHNPVLNLSFDGRVYESPAAWENVVTNRVSAAELTPARIFGDEPAPAPKSPPKSATALRFPSRDPTTPKELLNLTPFYNAGLNESWHGGKGNDLAALPKGLQTFSGVEFDVRGIVQLGSKSPSATNFPALIKGIPVNLKCQRLYFLHAAGFGAPGDEGKQVGTYVVHFATNQMRLEIPIRYGHEVRNWHALAGELAAPSELKVAWRGENAQSKSAGRSIRLFLTTWVNVAPDLEVESIDYVSALAVPAPFLIAISVE